MAHPHNEPGGHPLSVGGVFLALSQLLCVIACAATVYLVGESLDRVSAFEQRREIRLDRWAHPNSDKPDLARASDVDRQRIAQEARQWIWLQGTLSFVLAGGLATAFGRIRRLGPGPYPTAPRRSCTDVPADHEPPLPTPAADPSAELMNRYYERVGFVVMAVIAAVICAAVVTVRAFR